MVTSALSTSGSTPPSAVEKPSTTTTASTSPISSDKTRRNSPTSVTSSLPAANASPSPPIMTGNSMSTTTTTTTTTTPEEATTTNVKSNSVATRQGQDKKFWKKAHSSAPASAAVPPATTTTATTNATSQVNSDDVDDDDDDDSSTSTGTHALDDNDDDNDSDDDVVGGIMAVGVLKQPPPLPPGVSSTPASSSNNNKKPAPAAIVRKLPVTKQEATQQAISKTVAENLAEQEHKAKTSGRRPSSTSATTKPGAVKRRSLSSRESKKIMAHAAANNAPSSKSSASATAAPPATAAIQRTTSSDTASSHDEMMSIKNRERRSSFSSSSTAGGKMYARRLQRASSRAHAAGGGGDNSAVAAMPGRKMATAAGMSSRTGWSSSDDDNESSILSTTDKDAKAKAKMSRSNSIQATRRTSSGAVLLVRTKSGDSTSSGDTGSSMVAARKRAPSTRRSFVSRQDSLDDDDGDDDCGPSLAPVISSAAAAFTSSAGNDMMDDDDYEDDDGPALAMMPGAFSVKANGQHPDANNGKTSGDDDLEDTGPSLAPQVSTVSIMSTTANITTANNQEDAASDDDERVEDVDTGVVVAPGAFVMYGPDHDPNSESDDSVLGDNPLDDDLEIGAGLPAPSMNHGIGDNSEPFLDEPILLPVHAMVYDPTVIDATILQQDGERPVDPKKILRLRLAQLTVVLLSMVGIVFVVISVARGFGSRNDNNTPPLIPTVQGWSLMGGPIFGPAEEPQVLFGSAVAMSGDGKLLAVAAPGTDQGSGSLVVGELHFFVETKGDNGTEWTLIQSQSKPGPGPSDIPSSSLAMSRTGNQVVIGYPRFQGGQAQLYHQEGNGDEGDGEATTDVTRDLFTEDPQWKMIGVLVASSDDEKDKDASADPWFGYSVEVTPDGQYLAVGSPLTEPDAIGSQRGAVYFYQYNKNSTPGNSSSSNETITSSWTRLGDRLVGEPEEQHLGWSLALCSPSPSSKQEQGLLRVATGGPASNDGAGIVRVHELDVSNDIIDGEEEAPSWKQIGQTLVGSNPWIRFGESLAMSDDGTILAVGARGASYDPGQVQVFRLNSNGDEWIPDDQTLQGDQPGEGFGAAVSLSHDGNILAIGGPGSNVFTGEESDAVGHIKVFKYDNETKQWVQQGSSLGGSDAAAFGAALAMSADGQRVAGGAPEADFDGTEVDAGSVLVFNLGTEQEDDDNDEEGRVEP